MDITGKTIFDFCTDEELRKSITGDYDKEYYSSFPTAVKMSHIREYAIKTNNVQLFNEATAAQKTEEETFEAEQEEAQSKGQIIDY